jgi:hypothetical protein
MSYPILLTVHLFCALIFIGTVFFEVLILENVRKHVPEAAMRAVEAAIGQRARTLMPWVILLLFSAGIGMAWQHRVQLVHPFDNAFGTLLTIKIVIATSVFGHFLTAMFLRSRGRLNSRHFRLIHLSVFCHAVAIVLLAKSMFYVHF